MIAASHTRTATGAAYVSAGTTTLETAVGAAVVALAVAFFGYAYKTAGVGGTSSSSGYVLVAEFDNAEGINVGTDVRLAGIKVGSVTAQSLNTESYQARIEMTVEQAVSLARTIRRPRSPARVCSVASSLRLSPADPMRRCGRATSSATLRARSICGR